MGIFGGTATPGPDAARPAPIEAWGPAEIAAEQDEERELNELHEMLGKKQGSLSRGVFVKLQVAHENRLKADVARAEKHAVEALLEQRARDTHERIQRARMLTKDRDTDAYEAMQRLKAENVRPPARRPSAAQFILALHSYLPDVPASACAQAATPRICRRASKGGSGRRTCSVARRSGSTS